MEVRSVAAVGLNHTEMNHRQRPVQRHVVYIWKRKRQSPELANIAEVFERRYQNGLLQTLDLRLRAVVP